MCGVCVRPVSGVLTHIGHTLLTRHWHRLSTYLLVLVVSEFPPICPADLSAASGRICQKNFQRRHVIVRPSNGVWSRDLREQRAVWNLWKLTGKIFFNLLISPIQILAVKWFFWKKKFQPLRGAATGCCLHEPQTRPFDLLSSASIFRPVKWNQIFASWKFE